MRLTASWNERYNSLFAILNFFEILYKLCTIIPDRLPVRNYASTRQRTCHNERKKWDIISNWKTHFLSFQVLDKTMIKRALG